MSNARVSRRPLRSVPWTLAALLPLSSGCLDSTVPSVTLPWQPDGTWVGEASGTLYGQPFTGDLELVLLKGTVTATPGSPTVRVNLVGSWQWGSETGPLTGYWLTERDDDAETSGQCPATQVTCSVVLRLTPETVDDVCTEGPIVGQTYPILVLGWFNGADSIFAAGIEGTFWELQFEPPPCTGQVVVDFTSQAELARSGA